MTSNIYSRCTRVDNRDRLFFKLFGKGPWGCTVVSREGEPCLRFDGYLNIESNLISTGDFSYCSFTTQKNQRFSKTNNYLD